jgi:hypothetical protein
VHEYGHVGQYQHWSLPPLEEGPVGARIWSKVPSQGQNHIMSKRQGKVQDGAATVNNKK